MISALYQNASTSQILEPSPCFGRSTCPDILEITIVYQKGHKYHRLTHLLSGTYQLISKDIKNHNFSLLSSCRTTEMKNILFNSWVATVRLLWVKITPLSLWYSHFAKLSGANSMITQPQLLFSVHTLKLECIGK